MTNANDVRRAHDLLDDLDARAELSQEQEKLLRSFLPELPKQKTLEEIYKYVDDAWLEADDPESKEWLHELHAQLQGLKDVPANTPALPAGMRLADHKVRGRCVVSPKTDEDGDFLVFTTDKGCETGAHYLWLHPEHLTFIDPEPGHPEFLETEADYTNAPNGTIAGVDKVGTAWIKTSDAWHSTDGDRSVECPILSVGTRRILRWGWGNE